MNSFGSDCCKSTIDLHAFTGCESICAFADRSELSALKITQKDKLYQGMFG